MIARGREEEMVRTAPLGWVPLGRMVAQHVDIGSTTESCTVKW